LDKMYSLISKIVHLSILVGTLKKRKDPEAFKKPLSDQDMEVMTYL
jgi:hypothetical protein